MQNRYLMEPLNDFLLHFVGGCNTKYLFIFLKPYSKTRPLSSIPFNCSVMDSLQRVSLSIWLPKIVSLLTVSSFWSRCYMFLRAA